MPNHTSLQYIILLQLLTLHTINPIKTLAINTYSFFLYSYGDFMSLHILFLEDTPMMVEFVGTALKEAGFTYDHFPNPNQAVHALLEKPKHYDAVVSDWEMPPMCDGLTFLMDIRYGGNEDIIPKDMPFIMCTGWDCDQHKEDAIEAGANFYQVKSLGESLQPMINYLNTLIRN
ncbi:MAG: hypothetical protein CMF61_02895 [Magnetococcales bacterium]|nr:hypothetical protein [Magnetococcales bacterium]|tara:strand:+ start:1021 stop:1542 length:522 start_codon:yes stop_codon:yes gene_type:complete